MKTSEWLKIHAPEAYEPFIEALGGKAEANVKSAASGFYQFKYKKTKEGSIYWRELANAVLSYQIHQKKLQDADYYQGRYPY